MTRSVLEAPLAQSTSFERRPGLAIHLYRDRAAAWLSTLFGLVVLFLLGALVLGTFARSEAVRGYVSAASGLSRLDAQFPGVVQQILVKQGDTVKQGQTLMRLSRRQVTTGGVSTVKESIRSLTARKANLTADRDRLGAFLTTAKSDRDELQTNTDNVAKAMEAEEASLNVSLAHQNDMVRRVRSYLAQGYATRDALNTQERMAYDFERQILDLRAKRAQLKQQAAEQLLTQRTSVEDKETKLSTVQSELSDVEAQLAETDARAQIDIVAPVAGKVVGLFVEPGATVAADQVLTIVGDPNAAPLIVLDVPARAIGLARVGQEVVIKYDAFPYKTFGIARGVITAVSGSPARAPAATDPTDLTDAKTSQQSTYRVEVRPEANVIKVYGHDEPIRLGSTLTADIIVEHRRLIDWVLDPIRALRGRG